MSPAARTVVSMQLSQLVQASKLCHRRAAARPLSRTSDKPSRPCLATRSAHRELRQTMSISSVKRCLSNASSSVDHVPKSTRPSLRFSLRGQRSYVELLRGGGRAWGRGYMYIAPTIYKMSVNDHCFGCGANIQNDRHRRLLQSELSQHVIPLWTHIFNLELYKGERDQNDTRAMQLVHS